MRTDASDGQRKGYRNVTKGRNPFLKLSIVLLTYLALTLAGFCIQVGGASFAAEEGNASTSDPNRIVRDIIFVTNRDQLHSNNKNCEQGIECDPKDISNNTRQLAWGQKAVTIDDSQSLTAEMAIKFKKSLIDIVCSPMDFRCIDLYADSSQDLQSIAFGSYGLGSNILPVTLNDTISSQPLQKIFHTLSFLKVADEILQSENRADLTLINNSVFTENLEELFTETAQDENTYRDLLSRFQNTDAFRGLEQMEKIEDTVKNTGIDEDYIHSALLLHQFTSNFRARVNSERTKRSMVAHISDEEDAHFSKFVQSSLKLKKETLGEKCDAVLIYVHGFKNTPRSAITDAAILAEDSGFCGITVSFSWPSRGQLVNKADCFALSIGSIAPNLIQKMMKKDKAAKEDTRKCVAPKSLIRSCGGAYRSDQRAAERSVVEFNYLLNLIDEARLDSTKIHIVTHSMGGHLLATWAKRFSFSNTNNAASDAPNVSSITLVAPDVWTEEFEGIATPLTTMSNRVTILGTELDLALEFSRCLYQSEYETNIKDIAKQDRDRARIKNRSDRLGALSRFPLNLPPQITIVNVSPILSLGEFNHGYHRSSEIVASELGAIFNSTELMNRDEGFNERAPSTSDNRLLDEARWQDLVLPDHMVNFWKEMLGVSEYSNQ